MLTVSYSATVIELLLNRLLSWMRGITLVIIAVIGTSAGASAERRVALVVGNSNYKVANISLPNARNDAEDISAVLTTLGFEVVTATDATKRDMDFALQRFARLAIDADSALFFYAGHAVRTDPGALQYPGLLQHPIIRRFQGPGNNFLMPIDAEVEDEISLRYQTVDLEVVLSVLDRASGVKIIILDACHSVPSTHRLSTIGIRLCLGPFGPLDRKKGAVAAYATTRDEVAQDDQGRNGSFTAALLKRLQEPGLDIETTFRRVAYDVNAQTGGRPAS